ncbi:MAG TPA: NAD(P)/FAD-dependent oxidoreductase [Burkholderiales bacterium]|nr:NAD(P)/FAD-dependent oxidoreductase [Burkholderiales bacterium]
MTPDALANAVPATSDVMQCDVMVIGGGPGGATIAALLAARGRDVVLLEKEKHPRFHIGESLLPLNMPLFEKLGVAEEIRAIGMPKYGVEFVSPWHDKPMMLEFNEAWDKAYPQAYQVRRSQFDEVLFNNAVARGAHAFEETRATSVEFNDAGALVHAQGADGGRAWQAKFVVDASGRDTLLAGQLGSKRKNPRHNSLALFAHYEGVQRLAGKAEGNITVFWFDHGWFWLIPLADGTTSIGAVCWPYYMKMRKGSLEDFFRDTVALCPALQARLADATMVSPVTATGNYSYEGTRATGKNYLMVGDAFAFVDPVFSTGVYLAMNSGFAGADVIDTCLDRPAQAGAALRDYDATMRHGPKVFSWFIYRVTNPNLRDLFMDEGDHAWVKAGVISVLAGDVFRNSPIGLRILAFKFVYYLNNLLQPRRGFAAWRRRKRIIQETSGTAAA